MVTLFHPPFTVAPTPAPATKFIFTAFLLIKNLIFLYHIILSENFQSCYNGKPKNQLVLIDIHQYEGGCVRVAEVIKFQFYKIKDSI